MGSRETLFFAIEDDLFPILDSLEQNHDIEYVKKGRFETNICESYNSFMKISHLGFTDYGDWVGSDHQYLIKYKHTTLSMEEFKLSKGGVAFLIYQKLNPDTVVFVPNGIFTKKENVIVVGSISTMSVSKLSLALYKSLSSKLKKRFKKIGICYVGPKAEEKLKKGWRLVQIENSPREYDLAYPVK